MGKGISVVVCCFNSRARLTPTLQHLAAQDIGELLAEVIIVDNNSKDGTVEFAEQLWNALGNPYPLKVAFESKQGLSYARFCGVLTSAFEYIIFCDDDNWLAENYLQLAVSILNDNGSIGALGGFGVAATEVNLPEWFDNYKGGYAIGDVSISSGVLEDGIFLTGAGMAVRRSLFLTAFENSPSLITDRVGNQLSSGGDTEICLRFKLLGFQLFYERDLKFKHFIPAERLNESYRNRLFEGFKQHGEAIEFYQKLYWVKSGSLLAKIKKVLVIIIKLPFTALGFVKRWDLRRDLLMLYLITGIKFLNVDVKWSKLRDDFKF